MGLYKTAAKAAYHQDPNNSKRKQEDLYLLKHYKHGD